MNIIDIKNKASAEQQDPAARAMSINFIVGLVKILSDKYPSGTDVRVSLEYRDDVEKVCDSKGIPFYIVSGVTCSTAGSYKQLLSYENQR